MKFAQQGCRNTAKVINERLEELISTASNREQRMSKEAGRRLWQSCMTIGASSKTLTEAMFRVSSIREGLRDLEQEVERLAAKVDDLEFIAADYSSKILKDDSEGEWACRRQADVRDLRAQSFECIKKDTGPPYEAIMCKGKQVGRVLMEPSTDECPVTSNPPPLLQQWAGESDLAFAARRDFATLHFGCPCPKDHAQSNTQCCRKGEDTVTTQVTGSRVVNTCKCPGGMEYVSVAAHSLWREDECRPHEQQVDQKKCDANSFMKTSGTVCCQKEEARCRPACLPHEFRLKDGNCVASAKFGCFLFDQVAYQDAKDVRCLVPVSEAVLLKQECLEAGASSWEAYQAGPPGQTPQKYCKRAQNEWTTLYDNCTFNLATEPVNEMNCALFDKASFLLPSPAAENPLNVQYFTFVSETALFTAGLPTSATGMRKVDSIRDDELPMEYTTFTPSEDIDIQNKIDDQQRRGVLPEEVTELLETAEAPKHVDPFVFTESSFSMSVWGAPDKGSAIDDIQADAGVNSRSANRRVLSKDGFDPIDDGVASAFTSQLNAMKDMSKDFRIATGAQKPKVNGALIKGGQNGKQAKV